MTKRESALAQITVAGYQNDSRTAMRVYVENRVSLQAYKEAWHKGESKRKREQTLAMQAKGAI